MNQFLSRRIFILIPTMSILKKIFKPMQVLASSLASKEEWNLSKDEWKARLSPESYYILREEGTERAFSSQLNNEKGKGIFHCAGCDLPLFSSDKKFDSGTGDSMKSYTHLANTFLSDRLLSLPAGTRWKESLAQ